MHAPTVRCVVFFDALLATDVQMCNCRGQEDAGKAAEKWLLWPDMEKALQFALLSDAADKCMLLLRFADRENMDPSEIAWAVRLFVKSTMRLFLERGALQCGMTETMLKHPGAAHFLP